MSACTVKNFILGLNCFSSSLPLSRQYSHPWQRKPGKSLNLNATYDKVDLDKLIKKYDTELKADDFHKSILRKLANKHEIQQIKIDKFVPDKLYALKQ